MTRPAVEVADILRAQGSNFMDRYRNGIDHVRRKHQRLPSSLVIESAVKISVSTLPGGTGTSDEPALPMNAIRKDAPVVGGCREKNPDNRSTFER